MTSILTDAADPNEASSELRGRCGGDYGGAAGDGAEHADLTLSTRVANVLVLVGQLTPKRLVLKGLSGGWWQTFTVAVLDQSFDIE